jgi:membrane-associated phospholipid phosphatase
MEETFPKKELIPMFRRNLMYAAFWPFFGLCFYALEWLVPGREYHVMYHPIDDLIPFCELFLIPYLFWFVFMGFAYVYAFFADGAAFRRMMRFTILTYGGGLLMFLLYPTCQNLRPEVFPRDNLLTRTMGWFYGCDTSTNVCPSLHVVGSMAVVLAAEQCFRLGKWRWVIRVTGVLISISTVFVKQHSVLDVLVAAVVCVAGYFLCIRTGSFISDRSQVK